MSIKHMRISPDSNYISMAYKIKDRYYIPVHRLVMAIVAKRLLTKDDIVYHKNGIDEDNRVKNLELLTRSRHSQIHQGVRSTNIKRWKARKARQLKNLEKYATQNQSKRGSNLA